jgi:nucleotidyltransferase/DNA polymerase involved in DNA repair
VRRTTTAPSEKLESVPGIGPSLAGDLRRLGVARVRDLKRRSPERLYRTLCALDGPQDRCVLYAFRCAVYYASTDRHEPALLKWWNWTDEKTKQIESRTKKLRTEN